MDPGRRNVPEDGIAADFVGTKNGTHRLADATEPRRSARPLTSARAGRTAIYSKNESVPPGASRPVIAERIRSTSAAAKLFSGRPETITS